MKTNRVTLQDTFRVAWRNNLRNKRRFFINTSTLTLFQILYLLMVALGDGSYMATINSATSMFSGHYSLQHINYQSDPIARNSLTVSQQNINNIRSQPEVSGLWRLILTPAMIQSSHNSLGVQLMGIESFNRDHQHGIVISEGQNMNDTDLEALWISKKLLKKMRLKLNHKVILSTNTVDGSLQQQLFRIRGVYDTGRIEIDNNMILMSLKSAQRLLGFNPDEITRLAVNLFQPNYSISLLPQAQNLASNDSHWVSWKAIFPTLDSYVQSDRFFNFLFMNLLIMTILFMISNTFFMSGKERQIEYSTLLSIGTSRTQLQMFILLEVFILATIASSLALILSQIILWPLSASGINLSQAVSAQNIDIAGFSASMLIYPSLETVTLLSILLGIWLSIMFLGYIISFSTTRVSLTRRGQ